MFERTLGPIGWLKKKQTQAWSWEQPEIQQQIFLLRGASNREDFNELEEVHRCQILNNLANQLNSIGLFIQALETWKKCLFIEPKFGVTLGNTGCTFAEYARLLYDENGIGPFLGYSELFLQKALDKDAIYHGADIDAKEYFKKYLKWVRSRFSVKSDIKKVRTLIDYELGKTKKEKLYREWYLHNTLFLNLINDILPHGVAAADSLIQPPIITSLKDANPPSIIGFFSQIKQEYVTAG